MLPQRHIDIQRRKFNSTSAFRITDLLDRSGQHKMASPADPRKIHQPIHHLTRPRLDPQYIAIHDSHLQYIPPSESIPWGPKSRSLPGIPSHFSSAPVPVGATRDIDLGLFKVRAFMPIGEKPINRWPVLLWFHGGGCVLGDIGSENNFLTRLCVSMLFSYDRTS